MFYYLLHQYLLLAIGITLTALLGANHGSRYGVEHIWQVWLLALLLMPVLYFPCRAFARYKRASKQAWVRYF
jgi:Flp pilus assembly protein TadB